MRLDSEHGIKITGWRKRNQSVDINYNDPVTFRPLAVGKHTSLLWSHATMKGWMTKHMPPAFSFTKTRRRRYVLLLDRFIYTFKNDNPKHDFREFFELTANTNIFVTDQFPGVLYCIEIQRLEDGRTWYLQVENGPEGLKVWMDKLKRIVQCLKLEQEQQSSFNSQDYHTGVITIEKLDMVQLDSDNPLSSSSITQQQPYKNVKKPSVSSTSSSEYSLSYENPINNSRNNNSSNISVKNRYSTYSYYSVTASPPPQQPPPSIPPPPLPQQDLSSYYYYPEHQISVEHMTTSAIATASAASVSPMTENIVRRPSRLPDTLPPQLPPPTSTLPPPPLSTTSTSMR
ncbi:hypothetical protein BDC45DRAFT_522084 [Circinella umbellata]|nr:hypothetical protein BDC45DRAFT_522084 [Circinella umbellata]